MHDFSSLLGGLQPDDPVATLPNAGTLHSTSPNRKAGNPEIGIRKNHRFAWSNMLFGILFWGPPDLILSKQMTDRGTHHKNQGLPGRLPERTSVF